MGAASNRRHEDFQSSALPTELPSRVALERLPKRGWSLCRKRLPEQAEACARDSRCLGGQALACDQFHFGAEAIQCGQGRVDIWRNADALELFVHDRSGKDVVLVEKILH